MAGSQLVCFWVAYLNIQYGLFGNVERLLPKGFKKNSVWSNNGQPYEYDLFWWLKCALFKVFADR